MSSGTVEPTMKYGPMMMDGRSIARCSVFYTKHNDLKDREYRGLGHRSLLSVVPSTPPRSFVSSHHSGFQILTKAKLFAFSVDSIFYCQRKYIVSTGGFESYRFGTGCRWFVRKLTNQLATFSNPYKQSPGLFAVDSTLLINY